MPGLRRSAAAPLRRLRLTLELSFLRFFFTFFFKSSVNGSVGLSDSSVGVFFFYEIQPECCCSFGRRDCTNQSGKRAMSSALCGWLVVVVKFVILSLSLGIGVETAISFTLSGLHEVMQCNADWWWWLPAWAWRERLVWSCRNFVWLLFMLTHFLSIIMMGGEFLSTHNWHSEIE